MARTLAALYAKYRTDEANRFSNTYRAEMYRTMAEGINDPLKRFVTQLYQAHELLYAGRTDEAITLAEAAVQQMDNGGYNATAHDRGEMLHLLAACYLRQGEQSNCLNNHTNESCILPFSPLAQHKDQQGSRKAISVLGRILTEDPGDLKALWMLNVAYMTLGEHPDQVPAQWLIPASAFGPKDGFPHFEEIAGKLGVDVDDGAGGACLEDFNGDGLLDIIASSWSLNEQVRLFLSNGDGSFRDHTAAAGLTGITGGLNMVHADYDNDGHMDVLILRGGWTTPLDQPNSLLHNRGDGSFEDVTRAAGLFFLNNTQNACWGDYDNDGQLDLFIGSESDKKVRPCSLFHNNGNGTFTDVAAAAGVNVEAYIKGSVWGDVNNDGLLDLYLSNISGRNLLFINQGTTGQGLPTFKEVGEAAGVTLPTFGFPAWIFDYDNDGWLDIYAGAFPLDRRGSFAADVAAGYLGLPFKGEPPRLYRNKHDGTFEDVTKAAGLAQPLYAMGCNFGDLDNDGWLDFYLATGEPAFQSIIPNRMFHNDGHGHFTDVTAAGGFGELQKGHGVAWGDLDNDGDQDIYSTTGGAFEGDNYHNILFENPGMGNHWTTLVLEGTASNRCAIGSRVRVTANTPSGKRDIHIVVGTGGSFGSSSLRQEIGLGDATSIEQVEITWPATREKQVYTNVPMDRAVKLVEGRAAFEPLDLPRVTLKAPEGGVEAHHHAM